MIACGACFFATMAIARSIAAGTVVEMCIRDRDMANALTGRYADPAVNKAKVVVFVGHDTNIANIGGMLGLHWQLPG